MLIRIPTLYGNILYIPVIPFQDTGGVISRDYS